MRVLIVEPEKKPYVKEISEGLASLQKEVDGYIQAIYPWDEPVALICNDEAKLKDKPFNRVLKDEKDEIYDVVAGTFFIAGLGDDTFISLSDAQIELFMDKFAVPERFIHIGKDLIVVPVDIFADQEKKKSV